jgi:predicted DNA-binding protein (MmcQ/YjbR family)
MNIEEVRDHCLAKKGVTESFPFDDTTLVFKVAGKIFALAGISGDPVTINLKCDPEKAIELREQFPCVTPGFHMNKKHWNTVVIDGSVSNKTIRQWIDHSYDLVYASLTKKLRDSISF